MHEPPVPECPGSQRGVSVPVPSHPRPHWWRVDEPGSVRPSPGVGGGPVVRLGSRAWCREGSGAGERTDRGVTATTPSLLVLSGTDPVRNELREESGGAFGFGQLYH